MRYRNDERPLADEIEQTRQRLRIIEGLALCMREPYAVLDLMLEAEDPDVAVVALQGRFDIDEVQAVAVLDQQYRRATRGERSKLEDHRRELAEHLAFLRGPRRAAESLVPGTRSLVPRAGD